MIELSYMQMKRSPDFGNALNKLRRCASFGPKTAYTVAKLLKKVEE